MEGVSVEHEGRTLPAWSDLPALSCDELETLALAADSGQPVADDAVPINVYLDREQGTLPEWYMPAPWPRARVRNAWARATVFGLVGTFLVLEALGLCTTYGHVVIP